MARKERSHGTLDPKIPSKDLAVALNLTGSSLEDLHKRVMTPEAVLSTFVGHDNLNAYGILHGLLNARGYQWKRFVEDVQNLAQERVAPDVDFDWVSDDNRRIPLSDELLIVLDEGLTMAKARDEVYMGTEHLLVGMTHHRVSTARLLERYGITERAAQDSVSELSLGRSSTVTDHVALVKQGDVAPVYFREQLLNQLMELLSLASDRHVILVGQEGVGKRTLVYSLAQLIAEGKGPAGVEGVIEINESALLDNAKLAVQAGLRRAKGGILCVPHIARFFGGFRADFPETAGKELMKAFFDEELVVIGTATEAQYVERLQPSAFISGHAHVLKVDPATEAEAAAILDVLKPRFEADYKVQVTQDSLKETARLAGRYLTSKPLPASAVHLLHRTCAMLKVSARSEMASPLQETVDQTVDAEDVMVTVSQMTHIPVNKLGADERARYAHMVEHLRQRIIGQDEAVMAVSRAVKTARVGLKDPKRPVGSFFFLGPTGVGKTELAKALTEFLFGTEDSLIVLDMSEYQDENAVNRLIGAPPGYVGYEEGGQLTDKVAAMPYSVVLFDEAEKAHPRVLDVLLQIMEEGRLTDGRGRTVGFRDTVIILTSNIGGAFLVDPALSSAFAREAAEEELRSHFRPEFLNRLTDVIFFNRLGDDELRTILGLMLKKENKLVAEQGLELDISEEAQDWLLQQNEHPEWGARPLRRIIQRHIREPLADWLLQEDSLDGSMIHVGVKGQDLEFTK